MTEREEIIQKTGAQPNACACTRCHNACRKTPCIGTPEDMLKLVNNGYAHKIAGAGWAAAVPLGIPVIPIIAPNRKPDGSCAFLLPDNRCELHAAGLKPTEGTLGGHDEPPFYPLPLAVAETWLDRRNDGTLKLLIKAITKYDL